jgi:cell division protein FtsB
VAFVRQKILSSPPLQRFVKHVKLLVNTHHKIQDVFSVEMRMNQSSVDDEYEEVESPFAARSSEKSNPRDRLRTRKNVFNRPFATEPTAAPLIVEPTPSRRSLGRVDEMEMLDSRRGEIAQTEIEYLQDESDEEEVVDKIPRRSTRSLSKKSSKSKKNILPKIGWSLVGVLLLRLIFMDRGVWDYFATESVIRDKKNELSNLRQENTEIKKEILRIQTEPNFQRQLAKEHLGVIAADEFLILFAGESADSTELSSNQI